MKLTIEKIGRVKRAEIDLRPLTVFIGPNHTNKTWTAYLLYGTLQLLSGTQSSVFRSFESMMERDESETTVASRLRAQLKTLFDALQSTPTPGGIECSFDVAPLFDGISDNWHRIIAGGAVLSLLGLPAGVKSEGRADLSVRRGELELSLVSVRVVLEPAQNRLTMFIRQRDAAGESEEPYISVGGPWTEDRLVAYVFNQLWHLITHVLVFPTERNGLLPFTWPMMLAARYTDVAYPVFDFVQFLQAAPSAPRRRAATNDKGSSLYQLLQQVVGGKITYADEGTGTKKLIFRNIAGIELPLHAAASLSRAVAGLAVYLEHFFQPGDVLIIDELEMNAHPEAQLALTELMSALVNAGIRIVLTTHSPYVVDHLNNLMEASRVPAAKQVDLASKFALGTPASFISSDKVAVHAFEEETSSGDVIIRDVLNRESGLIDWSTFSRVSERIANLYSDILTAAEDKS